MISTGIEVIAPGATCFTDMKLFWTNCDSADSKTSVIPDFISNCGMARVFGYLMGNDIGVIEDQAICKDTSNTIKNALGSIITTILQNKNFKICF